MEIIRMRMLEPVIRMTGPHHKPSKVSHPLEFFPVSYLVFQTSVVDRLAEVHQVHRSLLRDLELEIKEDINKEAQVFHLQVPEMEIIKEAIKHRLVLELLRTQALAIMEVEQLLVDLLELEHMQDL
ncbi:uncharacterized protein LOC129234024 isoform X2 [Uloborus diversus]|uniref:uncharacterized protein LOC129234024 isoform X2 n=1 Tax=Uloborus diversus TaxID=327109 RepID=UPI00240A29C2|nr:uncharacterized protein LOC129234024 isoform X2 [Uloborus diversus]